MQTRIVKGLGLVVVAAAVAIALGACGPGDHAGDGAGGGVDGGSGFVDARPGPDEFGDAGGANHTCDKMDILFVVDDSPSMIDEQANLGQNFPRFVDVLDAYQTGSGAPLDYRVAITTTSVTRSWVELLAGAIPKPGSQTGPSGAMLQRCAMTRRWIERADGDVAGTFSCAAAVGAGGAGKEMPLLAGRLAFSDRLADGTNAGFHRDDALLAIVTITDEDDCSYLQDGVTLPAGQKICDAPDDVAGYIDFLDGFTGDRDRWATAVIAGHDYCLSAFGSAKKAARLQAFAQGAGAHAVFSSICTGDLAQALEDAVGTFAEACGTFPPVE